MNPVAVGLTRVSTAAQAEHGYSLADQEAAIRAYCERAGLQLLAIAADEGVSGSILDRPGVRKVQELAEAAAFQVLVAVKLDRLGRDNRVIQELLGRLRDLRIRVLFVEHGSADTPTDRLLLNVLGGVSEFEADMIRARTMAGREAKARTRKVMPNGSAPYGYRSISRAEAQALPGYAGRSGEWLIVEDQAATVRDLFEKAAAGAGLRELARRLNDAGIPSPRGSVWYSSTVRGILANEAYQGQPWYGRSSWDVWREVV